MIKRPSLTIFQRLMLGYWVVLALVLSVSFFSLMGLYRFHAVTRTVQEVDARLLAQEKQLTDTLLSQVQYERKFLIGKDRFLYDRFLLFHGDFQRQLANLRALASAGPLQPLVERIAQLHREYHALFEQEARRVRGGETYPAEEFRRRKNELVEKLLAELQRFGRESEAAMKAKIEGLEGLLEAAQRMTILIALAALGLGTFIALRITRSITRPIAQLKEKTAEIARGDFGDELRLASPPEIAALGSAFNAMSRRLRELERVKSDFFSTVSHELRTPLASIKEGTGLLLDRVGGPLTEKQEMLLRIIAEESRRLIDLVNSVLDLSKMEAGMMRFEFEPANVADLVHKALHELAPLAEAKRIQLHSEIARDLPLVRLDRERMLQVLRNLIGNAVKFTQVGGEVRVAARGRDHRVEIEVRDNGPGIPRESLERIFEKYQQERGGSAGRLQGTGLGLAIAKHTIAAHGGKIWAESEPGKGSAFFCVLPA